MTTLTSPINKLNYQSLAQTQVDRAEPTTLQQDALRAKGWILIALVAVLLIVFASRVVRLRTLDMDPDEVWSVWQTFGTPEQIVSWTPADWSPAFYLIVGGWQNLTGINPITLRTLTIFGFLIGLAVLYRLGKTIFDPITGLIAVVACAAMGYAIHTSLYVRAYSLIFTVTLLAWWLAIRYMRKPTLRRGVVLGLCAALMFYLHVTTIFALLFLGLYTFVLSPRRVWRWWLPALIAGILITPEAISKLGLASGKANTGMPVLQQWLAGGGTVMFQQIDNLLRNFAGYEFSMWVALLIIALAVIIERYRMDRRAIALGLWTLTPLFFIFMSLFDAYNTRHLTWIMPGYALWIGWGFSRFPRSAIVGLVLVFSAVMFGPVPIAERYSRHAAPLVSVFSFLQHEVKSGDVIVIDPNTSEISPEEWDYYARAYFPKGVEFVTNPSTYRRVWYAAFQGRQTPELFGSVQKYRAQILSTGNEKFTMRLYEAPPDVEGVLFANGIRFHGVEALNTAGPNPVYREGQTIRLRWWWSASRKLDVDYSVANYLLSSGNIIAQTDNPPQLINGPFETSRWEPDHIYVEERDIVLPAPLPTGAYAVALSVYQWWDNKRFSAPGTDPNMLLPALTIDVKAW